LAADGAPLEFECNARFADIVIVAQAGLIRFTAFGTVGKIESQRP
jgi:hypothetical protein